MPIVFYDGTCGICNRAVQFILARERPSSSLRFARLEGELGAAMRIRHPAVANVDSIVYLDDSSEPGRPCVRADAIMRIGKHLRLPWRLAIGACRVVPRALADAAYDAFAARRRKFLGQGFCLVPSPEQRARFLD